MNPGLRYLLRKRPFGWWRATRRRFKGTKGVLMAVGIAFVAAFLIGPQIVVMLNQTEQDSVRATEAARLWVPSALLVLALFGMSSGVGIYFKPSEIDFLFPAPIGRRELLLFNVVGRLAVVALSSLWVSIFVLRWASTWYGGILGIFCALAFLQLLAQLASLLLSTFSLRATKLVRRVVLVLLAGSIAWGWFASGSAGSEAKTLAEVGRNVVTSPVVQVLTAPTRVFVEIFTSESTAACAGWALGGFGILGLLFLAIVGLDIAYTEGAVRASRRVQQRLQRMRSGGGAAAVHAPTKTRVRLPEPPWLGGAGPIIWRQGVEVLRNLRGLAMTSIMIIGMPVVFVVLLPGRDGESGDARAISGAIGMIMMMSVFMSQNLSFDFRRDLDRMSYLKSLPLPAAGLAMGQLVPGIVLFAVLQLVSISIVVLASGAGMPWEGLALLIPFNWIALSLDNLLFLWFPYRFAPNEAGNFQFMGRAMAVMMAKMFSLALIGILAALAFWGVEELTRSVWFGIAGAGAVMLVAAMTLTHLLGRAFAGFDVTKDVPG